MTPRNQGQGMVPLALWLIPAIMLLIALLPLPYGYYTLLRLVVSISAAALAYLSFTQDKSLGVWAVAFIFAALLFNPIVPVYLDRAVWFFIDLVVAGLFGTYGLNSLKGSGR